MIELHVSDVRAGLSINNAVSRMTELHALLSKILIVMRACNFMLCVIIDFQSSIDVLIDYVEETSKHEGF